MRSKDIKELNERIKNGDYIYLYRNGSYVGILSSILRTDEDINVEISDKLISDVVVIKIYYINKILAIINADEWE